MAANLGYYNKDGFPKKHLRQNVCSICGGSISPLSLIAFSSASQSEFINSRPSKSNGNSPVYSSFQEANQMQNSEIEENERSYELDCRHSFHESVILAKT